MSAGRVKRVVALAMCGLLVACGPHPVAAPDEPAETTPDPAGTTRYTDQDREFSIALPSDWQFQADYQGTALTAFGPAAAEGESRPVINVSIEPLEPPLTLDQYAEQSQARLETSIYGLTVDSSGQGSLGGEPARWLVVTYNLDEHDATALLTYAVRGNEAYAVTALAEPGKFAELEPRLKELVGSFRFLADAER